MFNASVYLSWWFKAHCLQYKNLTHIFCFIDILKEMNCTVKNLFCVFMLVKLVAFNTNGQCMNHRSLKDPLERCSRKVIIKHLRGTSWVLNGLLIVFHRPVIYITHFSFCIFFEVFSFVPGMQVGWICRAVLLPRFCCLASGVSL
jgi:hypothetical protein